MGGVKPVAEREDAVEGGHAEFVTASGLGGEFFVRAGSVSDFVLHAAKQNGSAILKGIIRCWYFPVFPSVADQAFRLAACREQPVAQHPGIFSYDATPVAKSGRLLRRNDAANSVLRGETRRLKV